MADRAEEAEKRATAARDKAKDAVEQDRETSRAVAQQQADDLRAAAEAGEGRISEFWKDVQKNWSEHVAKVQQNIERKKAEIDRDRAETDAENAEDDAEFAVDYAYAAIVEAEYAVLDAVFARKQADELSGASA
jgi:hypothetical protein